MVVRFGTRITHSDADRVSDVICAFSPVSELTLDFSRVTEFDVAAVASLGGVLGTLGIVTVRLEGVGGATSSRTQ